MFGSSRQARFADARSARRGGLTLVEMLVAMALTLMIVFAIVSIFQWVGEKTTSSRAVLELAGQIRAASNLLQQDLAGRTAQTTSWNRDPGSGYFEVNEGTPNKDRDNAGVNSISGDLDDVISFTARSKDIPFTGLLNGVTYTSSLAEIVWWVGTDSNGSYNLYRRVLLIRPDLAVNGTGAGNLQQFYNDNDISVRQSGGAMVANSIQDLWLRQNRFAHIGDDGATAGSNGVYPLNGAKLMGRVRSGANFGNDVVLSKIVAFDMRVYDPKAVVYPGANSTLLTPTDPGYSSASAKTAILAGAGTTTTTPVTTTAIDAGGSGWSSTGTWLNDTSLAAYCYNGNEKYVTSAASATATASWTFSGLTPGQYKVFANWAGSFNQATNAPYSIYDGASGSPMQTVPCNQQVNSAGTPYGGVNWTQLATVTITATSLKVTLTNQAGPTYVAADGVMIQNVPVTTTTATVAVGEGAFVDLGYDPDTYRYKQTTTTSGTTTATTYGAYVPIDAGGSGWTSTGSWLNDTSLAAYCYNGNEKYVTSAASATATASWTFSGLTPGQYKVFANWAGYSNQATNAPYSIYDNTSLLQTVPCNQQANSSGTAYSGVNWTQLATVSITSTTLKVTLTNQANGTYVAADGVMIQSVIPGVTTGGVNVTYEIPLSNFSKPADPNSKLPVTGTWDTWPEWFENNGIDEDGDSVIDNASGNGSTSATDASSKRDTSPPYTSPLRGILVIFRVYEPQSRQVLQRSIVESFVR